jgi:hypothetical protein
VSETNLVGGEQVFPSSSSLRSRGTDFFDHLMSFLMRWSKKSVKRQPPEAKARPEPWLKGPARAGSESLIEFSLPRHPLFFSGGGASFAPLLNDSDFSPKVFDVRSGKAMEVSIGYLFTFHQSCSFRVARDRRSQHHSNLSAVK